MIWDEVAQESLHTTNTTTSMVLVQDNITDNEHVIYYMHQNIFDTKSLYAHVEKLALAVAHAVQIFRPYFLLWKATMISDCNSMTYILTHQLLGGKYSKWIMILKEFDLEFTAAKLNNLLIFAELICSLPSASTPNGFTEQMLDEFFFFDQHS